ncbi:glucokinase [Nocardioides baekrokdamisoli]|uniref:Glucokinase n=1 Tax=Nocardioides baekrokdamisoli TaxID=1804624 RepID=A0A3G9IGW2_9ACTN|nr:ROK family protein [Nocardioides baekrokdamisoli]BBH18300.1 glucokinase [Nocardioides baekrokdamisoli]
MSRNHPREHGSELFIGLDVGGSKVLAAEIDADGHLVTTALRITPGRRVPVPLVEDALTEAVDEVAAGRPISGVGLAAAGFVDAAGERVMFAPHLPWRSDPTRSRLEARWGVPVAMDNDANCAARAELALGAAAGTQSALMITLGTGIGGGLIVDGKLRRGRNGMSGEFGHMQVVPDGHPCECGRAGCWEQYASGNALVRYARSRLDSPSYTQQTSLEEACGGLPEQLTGPMIAEAGRAGDRLAQRAFTVVGEWLGVGIANLVAAFDPEVVVVGGGVSAAGDLLLDPARAALRDSLVAASEREIPDVVPARFGPEAGVVGAAAMIRDAVAARG